MTIIMAYDQPATTTVYKTYRSRWFVLLATVLLTCANQILWISFASVNTFAADYYDKDPAQIDLLSMVSLIVGLPFCLASTWIIDKLGLRAGVFIATSFTFAGGLVRCLSTFPGLNEQMSPNTQFWLSFTGQAITGMGNPIAVSLPTKVSQHWFSESERTMATSVLALALPIGIAIGYGGTTIFVTSADDIPLMNIVWFVPALVTFVYIFFGMRTSKPPTPPSKSAEFDQESQPYLQSMKKVLTNPQFLLLFFAIGGAVGFFSAFLTLLQNMMCSRGYDSWFSGLCGSLMLCTGPIGAIGAGWVVQKTGRLEETAKVMIAFGVLMGLGMAEFTRKSDAEAALIVFYSLFGVFAFGFYPLGLELSVEATYPADEAAGTALIFLSGQIQGAILVLISNFLKEPLSPEAEEKEMCTELGNGDDYFVGQNHTDFLMFLAVYMTAIGVIFIVFFRTDYKRQRANVQQEQVGQEKITKLN